MAFVRGSHKAAREKHAERPRHWCGSRSRPVNK